MSNGTAAVRISVKDGVIEISGSENFVNKIVSDPKQLQALYQQIRTDRATNEAENAKDYVEAASDQRKATLDNMIKMLQLMKEMSAQTQI